MFRVFCGFKFVSIRVRSWFLITAIVHPWLVWFVFPTPSESPWPPPCMIRTFPLMAAKNCIPSDDRAIRRSCNGIRCPIVCMELRRACHSACPESVMISTGRCSMPRNLDDISFSVLLYATNLPMMIKTSNIYHVNDGCSILKFSCSAVFYMDVLNKQKHLELNTSRRLKSPQGES